MTDHPAPSRARCHPTTALLGGPAGVASVGAPARTEMGEVGEYPVTTTPDGFPAGITTGPDGALWFTESNVPGIGRITAGGALTEFGIPSPDGAPFDITRGPDNALWFTEFSGRVGRITTRGQVTGFPMPPGAGGALGITRGPDRALWFTELLGNAVGRVRALPGGAWQQQPGHGAAPAARPVVGRAHPMVPPGLCGHRALGPRLPDRVREVFCRSTEGP